MLIFSWQYSVANCSFFWLQQIWKVLFVGVWQNSLFRNWSVLLQSCQSITLQTTFCHFYLRVHYAECSSHDEDFLERRTATTWPFLQLIDQQLLGNGKNGENKDKDCSNSSDRYSIELWWWQQLSSSLLTLQITSSSRWLPVLPHRSWVMTVTDTAPTILLTKIKTARNAEHFSASGYLLQPHRANWTNCTKSALCME